MESKNPTGTNSILWDVIDKEGNLAPTKTALESDAPSTAVQTFASKVGTPGAVVGYIGVGGALSLWWGNTSLLGLAGSTVAWPLLLGLKVVSALLMPVLALGVVGAGGYLYLSSRKNKLLGRK